MIKKTILALSLAATATTVQAGSYSDTTLNNSFATAANINPFFTTEFSPDIGNSSGTNTSLAGPWVTIAGQGNGASDYFSFDVSQEGQRVTLDIDYTMAHPNNPYGFDAKVALWRQVGTNTYSLLNSNDDFDTAAGAGGSVHPWDSFLVQNVPAGHYIADVAEFPNQPDIASDRQYTLQVQVSPVPEPGSYAMLLVGLGIIGAVYRRKQM